MQARRQHSPLSASVHSSPVSSVPSSPPSLHTKDPQSPTPSPRKIKPLRKKFLFTTDARNTNGPASDIPVSKVLPPIDPKPQSRPHISPPSAHSSVSRFSSLSRISIPNFAVDDGKFVNGVWVSGTGNAADSAGDVQEIQAIEKTEEKTEFGGPLDFTENLEYWMRDAAHGTPKAKGVEKASHTNYPPQPTVEDERGGKDADSDDSFSPVDGSTSPNILLSSRTAQVHPSHNVSPATSRSSQPVNNMAHDRDDSRSASPNNIRPSQSISNVAQQHHNQINACSTHPALPKPAGNTTHIPDDDCVALKQELEAVKADMANYMELSKIISTEDEEQREALKQKIAQGQSEMGKVIREMQVVASEHDRERAAMKSEAEAAKAETARLQQQMQQEIDAAKAETARARDEMQKDIDAAKAETATVREQMQKDIDATKAETADVRAQMSKEYSAAESDMALVAQTMEKEIDAAKAEAAAAAQEIDTLHDEHQDRLVSAARQHEREASRMKTAITKLVTEVNRLRAAAPSPAAPARPPADNAATATATARADLTAARRTIAELRAESALMGKVLLQQWGREDLGPSQPQAYRYKYARPAATTTGARPKSRK